jgi:hypothetical protein
MPSSFARRASTSIELIGLAPAFAQQFNTDMVGSPFITLQRRGVQGAFARNDIRVSLCDPYMFDINLQNE